ncbi:MAG: GxxExxY protein, partial [Verrucomicrobiota bacterium]
MNTEVRYKEITGSIIESAITVHRELGPGLLESIYEKCLALELHDKGHSVVTQQEVPVTYKKKRL